MSEPIAEPPSPTSDQYYLKITGSKPLYLRLHGDGINAVVLTAEHPKFLRWTHNVSSSSTPAESSPGTEIAISWKQPTRSFGLVLCPPRAKYGWEEVQVVENEGSGDFIWVKNDEGKEVLRWKGGLKGVGGEGGGIWAEWKGFMWCPWVHGHPQLFWITGLVDKELPPFCERVEIIREWLVPRDE